MVRIKGNIRPYKAKVTIANARQSWIVHAYHERRLGSPQRGANLGITSPADERASPGLEIEMDVDPHPGNPPFSILQCKRSFSRRFYGAPGDGVWGGLFVTGSSCVDELS